MAEHPPGLPEAALAAVEEEEGEAAGRTRRVNVPTIPDKK